MFHTLRRGHSTCAGMAALGLLLSAGHASAQCAGAWNAIGGPAGGNTAVLAMTNWDPDGPGPLPTLLVVAGEFNTFMGMTVNNIVTWDGSQWAPLAGGVTGIGGAAVDSLVVLPDGRLAVSGVFNSAGGVPANNVAVCSGNAWAPLGAGTDGEVYSLCLAGEGDLYAGGTFSNAGGAPAAHIARWNGTNWVALGAGVTNIVYAIAPLPGGSIAVGGAFTSAGGVANRRYVAQWNGTTWAAMGPGMNAVVLSLGALSDGTVVAGGTFTYAGSGPASRIARWNGSTWLPVAGGLNAQPLCFLALPNGQFIAGGHFWYSPGSAATLNKIALWDGLAWQPYDAGLDNYVMGMAIATSGDLFVGGGFTTAGGLPSPYLAKWSTGGTPTILTQPSDASACPGGSAVFHAVAAAPPLTVNYAWQFEDPTSPGSWQPLNDGPLYLGGQSDAVASGSVSPDFSLSAAGSLGYLNNVRFRCTVSTGCGSVDSAPATLHVGVTCDFNQDGGTDLSDVFDLADAIASGTDPNPGCKDFNQDGSEDTGDVLDIADAVASGTCP